MTSTLTNSKTNILLSWLKQIPYSLGLSFPYTNGEIAVLIFRKEIEDYNFLPHSVPLNKRAEFAIPLIGEENIEKIKESLQYKKAITIAKVLITRHYRDAHGIDCQGYIEDLEEELTGYELTDEEKELIASPAGFWNG